MLKGNDLNLRVVEKDDLPAFAEWVNDPEFAGEFQPLLQISRTELEKQYDKLAPQDEWFFIEKKDGSKIGFVRACHLAVFGKPFEIGFTLIPSARGKGYGTEAVQIIVDYLFLSKDIVRIQAHTIPRNLASQRTLEKAGFRKEGVARKLIFIRGEWQDALFYGILREEWKEPKVLTRTT